jgi:5-deoxy-D-glucuronate isomerase
MPLRVWTRFTGRIFAREFLVSTHEEGGIDQLIFRGTDKHTGRHVSVTPGNSSMKHMAYGRIILNAEKPAESFSTGDRETGLIVLSGSATVTTGAKEVTLGQYDAI